jgi:hypothetical protein
VAPVKDAVAELPGGISIVSLLVLYGAWFGVTLYRRRRE